MPNQKFLTRGFVLFLCFLLNSQVFACDLSSLTINSVTPLPSNRYQFSLTMCAPGGCDNTWVFGCLASALNGNTGNWGIQLSGGATFVSFPSIMVSPQTAAVYTGSLGSSTLLNYTNLASWWSLETTAQIPTIAYCVTFSIVTQGMPTGICALGLEGEDSYVAPACTGGNTCQVPVILNANWMSVSGQALDNAIQLNWDLKEGSENSLYIVERAIGQADFAPIGEISSGGSAKKSFFFNDPYPEAGKNHYRILAVDQDGEQSYSKVVEVSFRTSETGILNVFPVPASDRLTLKFASEEAGDYTLLLTSSDGRTLKKEKVWVENGLNPVEIDLTDYPAGFYFAQLIGSGKKYATRFVKQ